MALKGKYKDNAEFGRDLKKQKDPTYEERALLAFSIIETAVGLKLDEKVILLFINEVAAECGQDPKDVLKILTHLLSDNEYCSKIMKKYKAMFAKQEVKLPG
jgi:hypothetical protein